jgi:hypothetical protein
MRLTVSANWLGGLSQHSPGSSTLATKWAIAAKWRRRLQKFVPRAFVPEQRLKTFVGDSTAALCHALPVGNGRKDLVNC